MLAEPDISPRLEAIIGSSSPDEPAETPTPEQPAESSTPDKPGKLSAPDKPAKPPRLSRQLEVLDFSSSKSWAGRLALQQIALEQIARNPLVGKFGGHVLTEDTGKYAKGHTGRYAHNALSAWVSYGLVGFLMYISLTLIGFLVPAYHVVLKQQNTPLWTFAFMLNFVFLLLIIVSKPVFWPLPALGWGVLAQALINSTTGTSNTLSGRFQFSDSQIQT